MSGDVRIILSGDNRDLSRVLSRSGRLVDRFAQGTQTKFRRMGRRIGSSMLRLGKGLASPFAAMVGGAAIYAAGRELIGFDSRLSRLAIQAGKSRKEQMLLRKEIIDVGMAAKKSRSEVLSGLEAIVQRTGDLNFAQLIMNDMAIASTATGAAMGDLGALSSNLQQKLNLAADEIKQALNILTVQGKAGAFTLEDMANQGERLFASAGRLDMKGLDDVRKFGAFIQIARMGTGSAEQATTAVERTLANILAKQKQIRKQTGFSIFKEGTKTLKSIDVLLKGIIKGARGDEALLGKIFGEEGIRAVTTLAKVYRETGGFDLFDKLIRADIGRQGELLKDFARYSEESASTFQTLANVAVEFADAALAPVVANLTRYFQELTGNPAKMEKFRNQIKYIGEELASVVNTVVDLAASIADLLPLLDILGAAVGTVSFALKFPGAALGAVGREMGAYSRSREYAQAPYALRKEMEEYNRVALRRAAETKYQHESNITIVMPESAGGAVVSKSEGDERTTVKLKGYRGDLDPRGFLKAD